METNDHALLRQYAERHSQEAFATLVSRYVNLVYSVALRRVQSSHLTETNQRILDQAASFLTPQQLAALATLQNTSLKAQKLQGAALTQKH